MNADINANANMMLTPEEAAADAAADAAVANAPYVSLFSAAGFSLLLQDLPAGGKEIDRLLTLVRLDSAVGDSFPSRAVRSADWVWGTDLNRGYRLVGDDGGIDLAAVAALVTDLMFHGDLCRSDLHWSNVKDLMAFLLGMAKA